jgi:hypothetical protein
VTQTGSIDAAAVICPKAASRARPLLADSVEKVGLPKLPDHWLVKT